MAAAELTVVVPAYNRAALLPRTLASIAAQTLRPLRVVLVDNRSTDDTLAVMHRWAAEQDALPGGIEVTVAEESRRGASHARNAGLALADTPWVAFFDSDDEMLPHHLADLMAAAHAHPGAEIVGRPLAQQLLDGRRTMGRFTTVNPLSANLFHGIMATPRYIARTELVRRAGGWHRHATGWEDMELGLRLLLLKPVMAAVDSKEPAVIAYSQVSSVTGTDFSSSPMKWEQTLDICDDDIATSALPPRQKRALAHIVNARRLILSARYHAEGSFSESKRLKRIALQKAGNRWSRLRYRLIWLQNRAMRRATAQFTALLFPSTRI